MRILLFLATLLLIGTPSLLFGQRFLVDIEQYGVEEGMPDRTIWDINSDSIGLIWMATGNGLCRFDGYSFKTISSNPNSPFSLPAEATVQLQKMAPNEVLIRYRGKTIATRFNLTTFEQSQVDLPNNLRGSFISSSSEMESVYYVIRADDSLHIHRWNADGFFKPLISSVTDSGKSYPVLPVPGGRVLYSDGVQFQIFRPENTDEKRPYEGLLDRLNQWRETGIQHLASTAEYLWVVRESTIHQFDYERRQWASFPFALPEDEQVYKTWIDGKGNILLASVEEVERYPDVTGLQLIQADGAQIDYRFLLDQLERKIIRVFSEDFGALLWVGTHKELFKVNLRTSSVRTFLNRSNLDNTFGATMRGIEEAPDRTVYIAREVDYWYRYFPEQDSLAEIRLIDRKTGRALPSWQNGTDLLNDDKGGIWGSLCFGNQLDTCQLLRFDLEDEKVDRYPIEGNIRAIGKRLAGGFWVAIEKRGQEARIFFFDSQRERFVLQQWITNKLLKGAIPLYIKEIDGVLYIGMYDKLIIANLQTQTVDYLDTDRNRSKYLSSPLIFTIEAGLEGRVLIGTSRGIDRYDSEEQTIGHIGQQDGLSDERVAGIIPLPEGDLWVSTFRGLNFIDMSSGKIQQFFTQDGLTDNEFNRFSYELGSDGQLYFGGINGFNVFRPEDLIPAQYVPTPVVTKIELYDGRRDSILIIERELGSYQNIQLSPHIQYIQFDFAMPSFVQPERHQYEHKLVGLERDWIRMGFGHQLRYNKLPAGAYNLLIRGTDEVGQWSEQPLEIQLEVGNVFYKTFAFQSLMLCLMALLIYGVVRYMYHEKLRRARLRTKISSDLHDEVSGLLAGIAMQSDLLGMQLSSDPLEAKARQIGEVSRSAMSRMSDVLWSIDGRKDSLKSLIVRMQEHLNETLGPLDIRYQLDHDFPSLTKKLSVDLRQNIYFLFKEAINNIAKHSNASHVWVTFKEDNGQTILIIRDDGTQSPLSNKSSGQGLSNMEMRAERIGAELTIKQDQGFTVKMLLTKLF